MRSEQAIFDKLAKLCSAPGYIHAIAYFSLRDAMIGYSGEMKADDMLNMFSKTRLIRTELTTLIGLLLKNAIVYNVPEMDVLQQYIDQTEAVLQELHHSISKDPINLKKIADEGFNPFTSGEVLREPIFYSGDSAYSFQYRDLALKKYTRDNEWLMVNKGFSIDTACTVIRHICRIREQKLVAMLKKFVHEMPTDKWTFLSGFIFTTQEVTAQMQLDIAIVRNVLAAFSAPAGGNADFTSFHDFNVVNAYPLIQFDEDTYILFNINSLVEALYESPFYWMGADEAYASTAMRHRGCFTEEVAFEYLVRIFGKDNVHANVDLFESNTKKIGEIDVLVLFGNRAIVLQAKSKRLTLEARRGNDSQIRQDFKKSIQDSCDQAYKCAKILCDPRYTLRDKEAKEISITMPIREVYVLCVIADHYPALSFQVRQFLEYQATRGVSPPFILDLFTLDAMTEMLNSPLHLLSYIDRRTKYHEKLIASHELTILGYHLTHNLWLSGEYDMVMLEDDLSIDLDLAMFARREGLLAKRTPDGILTRFAETTLGRLVREIETRPDPGTIELGFMLLTFSEETFIQVSRGIDEIARRAHADGKGHDFTVSLAQDSTGLTVHSNYDPIEIAGPNLQGHCYVRKYTEKAHSWYGICVSPRDALLRFGVNLDFVWEHSDEMDALTKDLSRSRKFPIVFKTSTPAKRKVRRNELCPCGSGKKYRKCCLPR